MNERDLIATQTIKQVSEGGDQVRADLKATASVQDQLAASSTNLATVTETSARRQTSAAAAFNALARSMDPAARAFADFERNQATFDRALSQNSSMLDKAGQSLDLYRDKLDAAATAAESLRRQQANVRTDPAAVTGSVNNTPISLNQITGSSLSNVNTKEYAAEFEAAAKAQDDMAAAAARLRTAINPLEAEQAKLAQETILQRQAMQAGLITADQYAAGQAALGKRLGDFAQNLKTAGTAGRVMSGELVNLGYQLNDVVTGLALGQSPFMILAQQGGQVTQIFQNSKASIGEFASTVSSSLMNFFTVGRVAFAGVATAIGSVIAANASYIASQREVTQSLIGIGAKTQTTSGQINQFAKDNASATGLSVDQARSVAVEFTKTGNIAVSGLKNVGDAVHGFSVLTGQSAEDASKSFAKAFSGDLVSGAEDLNKTYGFLDAKTRDYIRTLELQGDRSAAVQVVIDAIAKDNARAADSVSLLTKAYDALANAASKVKNTIGVSTAPQSNEDQLASLQKQKDALGQQPTLRITDPSRLIGNPLSAISDILPPSLGAVNRSIDELNAKIASVKADNVVKQLKAMSLAGDDVVRSAVPEIAQIEKLQAALNTLNDAQNTPGVSPGKLSGQNDNAAIAIQNQINALQEAQAGAVRYNDQIAAVSKSWGDVGQSTAKALDAAQTQLPVIQAVGGAAKMAAQYAADYTTAMRAGKTETEATALAASNLAAAQAAATSSAKETLFNLQNQAGVAAASTEQGKIQAQQQATYNKLVHDGVQASTAGAVADQEASNAQAQANVQAEKQAQSIFKANAQAVRASEQNLDLLKAQGTGSEALVASTNAWENAVHNGATASQAAIISVNTLEAETIKLADAADQAAASYYDVAHAANIAAASTFNGGKTGSYEGFDGGTGSTGAMSGPAYQLYLASLSARGSARDKPLNLQSLGFSPDATLNSLFGPNAADTAADKLAATRAAQQSAVGDQFTLRELQAGDDKTAKLGVYSEEMAYYKSQPQTIASLTKIASLQQSIDSLTQSTNSLNATNQDLLSPYYTQDPRTSHIGFRSQGMASGGEFTVPGGYSANDNMIGTIPLASGEIVSVRRPGDSAGGTSIQVTNHIYVSGNVDKATVNAIGRTTYQSTQSAARGLQAASQ